VSGDQVMAALELRHGAQFQPVAFREWLHRQSDLGTKWAPRFVRITTSLPQTATGKVTKTGLRAEAWRGEDQLWWRPDPRSDEYRPFTDADRRRLDEELERNRRSDHG
jgi:fatty-acyl-CoA synthase